MSGLASRKRWTLGGFVAGLGAMVLLVVSLGAGAGTAARAALPVSTAPPTVSGTPQVGLVLTASEGTWINSPTAYAYQWLRCNSDGKACRNVGNATLKTYTLAAADARHAMRVSVTAKNADGSADAQSVQTAVVTGAASTGAPPVNTSAPTIAGIVKAGQRSRQVRGTGRASRPATPSRGSAATRTLRRARTSRAQPTRRTRSWRRPSAIASG